MNFKTGNSYKVYSTSGRVMQYINPLVNIDKTNFLYNSVDINSNNLIIVDGNETFDLFFDIFYENSYQKDKTILYYYDILKMDPKTKLFNQKVYTSESFTDISEFGQKHYLSNFKVDGEYMVKNYFKYSNKGLFKNVLVKDEISKGFNDLEHYFILIEQPKKPTLFSNNNVEKELGVLRNIVIEPKGQDELIINHEIKSEIILTLNGFVLTRNHDYTFNNNIIKLNTRTRETDIINIFYTSNGNSMSVEVFDFNGLSTTKNVNYNKDKGTFELSLEKGLIGEKEIVTLNGRVLTNGKDYVRSISDERKLIIFSKLLDSDILNVFYSPKLDVVGEITNTNPHIGWYISNNPDSEGDFILEISKYEDFRNICFSKTIPYNRSSNIYKTNLDFDLETFVNYNYRVQNNKRYKTFNGGVIELNTTSNQYKFKIVNNKIKSY